MNLENKIIVVTGAAGLIGQELSCAILENHGRLVIAELDEKSGTDLYGKLSKKFGSCNVYFHKLDITNRKSIELLIENTKIFFKDDIYGLVNNAYPRTNDFNKDFFEVEYETMCQNLSMHLGGYFLCTQVFAQEFKKLSHSSIVNFSSIYGVMTPNFSIYEGTDMTNGPEYALIKSGVVHLSKFAAQRLKKFNIRVNTISPGGILNNQPKKFVEAYKKEAGTTGMLNPNAIKDSLILLLNPSNNHITGQNIIIDDGFSL